MLLGTESFAFGERNNDALSNYAYRTVFEFTGTVSVFYIEMNDRVVAKTVADIMKFLCPPRRYMEILHETFHREIVCFELTLNVCLDSQTFHLFVRNSKWN